MLALRLSNPSKPQPSVSETEEQRAEVARGVLDRLRRGLARTAAAPARAATSVVRAASRRVVAPVAGGEAPSEPDTADDGQGAEAQGPPLAEAGAAAETATTKVAVPFTPITLVCRDLRYYVPDPSGGQGGRGGVCCHVMAAV